MDKKAINIILKKIPVAVALILAFAGIVGGGSMYGPEYSSAPRYCDRDSDCHLVLGEGCLRSYKGCPQGICSCDTLLTYRDNDNFCRPRKFGEDSCDHDNQCPRDMRCYDNHCRCEHGEMTSDRTYCVKDDERLLGRTCHPLHHKCLQQSAPGIYTTAEVECVMARCQCKEGYKPDKGTCRKWKIEEYGCSKDHQCQGGALCVDSVCRCPNGYLPEAGYTKCARFGSRVGRSFGETCDEIGESLYCLEGLVCHRCVGQSQYVCVMFSESAGLQAVSSAPSLPSSKLGVYLLCIFQVISTLVLLAGNIRSSPR